MTFSKIGIVGVGLLGGSLIKDVSQWPKVKVIGFCRNQKSKTILKKLRLGGSIESLADVKGRLALKECDFVVLAMPVNSIIDFLKSDAMDLLHNEAVVTDVGSTKKSICDTAKLDNCLKGRFIGSHPMAGSEKQGAAYSEKNLFKDQSCFVVNHSSRRSATLLKVKEFWSKLGSGVIEVKADEHDRIVAKISHMPHLISTILIQSLMSRDKQFMSYGRSGLASVHRAAGSNPAMWAQIIQDNKKCILKELQYFQSKIDVFKKSLQSVSATKQLTNLLNTHDYDSKFRKHIIKYEKTSRSD